MRELLPVIYDSQLSKDGELCANTLLQNVCSEHICVQRRNRSMYVNQKEEIVFDESCEICWNIMIRKIVMKVRFIPRKMRNARGSEQVPGEGHSTRCVQKTFFVFCYKDVSAHFGILSTAPVKVIPSTSYKLFPNISYIVGVLPGKHFLWWHAVLSPWIFSMV